MMRFDLGWEFLKDARLSRVDLRKVDLRNAQLSGATLVEVKMQGADLRGADLRTANLDRAKMEGADLRGVDLTTTTGLTCEQIMSATIDNHTRLPDYLKECISKMKINK